MDYSSILSSKKEIYSKICQKFDELFRSGFKAELKEDNTPVTLLDEYISQLFKGYVKNLYQEKVNFYSEEEHGEFKFPVCILDPIDGTKELVKNSGEWAVSFTVFHSANISDKKNFSWVFNPVTGFEISSVDIVKSLGRAEVECDSFVSHSESKLDLFQQSKFKHISRGSIAYKLALLAKGHSRFQVSLRDKNVWDIAAGTHLLHLVGIDFYINKEKQSKLSSTFLKAPLIWCRSESKEIIFEHFHS